MSSVFYNQRTRSIKCIKKNLGAATVEAIRNKLSIDNRNKGLLPLNVVAVIRLNVTEARFLFNILFQCKT